MDLNLLKIFSKVAELGSFTQAAKVLNQPKSRVSRAISRLENELDVQLIRRTTRRSSLTNEGQEFYQNIAPLLNGINNELIRVGDTLDELTGVIRVTASDSMAQTFLSQIISEYNKKYSKVQFDLIITNEYLDLTKENIDIAFRAGKLEDSSLIQKKFKPTNFILVASPLYLNQFGCPKKIKDLEDHKFLSFTPIEKNIIPVAENLQPVLRTDSLPMLLKMVLEGSGITVLPNFICDEYFDDKSLMRVIPNWSSRTEHLHILYPPSKNISKKVRLFVDMAMESLLA